MPLEIEDTSGSQVEEVPSLRETINEAVAEHSGVDGTEAPVETGEHVEVDPSASVTERARDQKTGRFVERPAEPAAAKPAPKPGAKPASPAPGASPGKEIPPAAAPFKGPQSWKPAAREALGKADPLVQQEVMRREAEVQRVLQESAGAKRIEQSLRSVVGPYEPFLRSQGANVFQTIDTMMRTEYALRTSNDDDRAALVAKLCEQYKVDPSKLDEAWFALRQGGQPAQHRPAQPQQVYDPRLDPLIARLQENEEASFEQTRGDLGKWSEGKTFYADVKLDMADVIEMRAKRGLETTWDQAYDLACRANPDVAPLYEQQKAAERVQHGNQVTARSRAAASSVRPSSGLRTPVAADPSDLRGLLEEGYAALQRR